MGTVHDQKHSHERDHKHTHERDHHPDETYRITAAPTSHTDDISVRYRKYVISMVIRTLCVVCFAFIDHWTRWLFVAGAVFLPYVAVVLANAGRESRVGRPESFDVTPPQPQPPQQLPALEARITGIHSPRDDR